MTTYSQRYSASDTSTAGAFAFDTISSIDYAVSKLAFGDATTITRVDASNPLPTSAAQSGTWNVGTVTTITNVVHVDDNSSTLSIDDGGGSITVDGTVAVSGTITSTISGTVTVDSELTTADLDTGAGTDTRAVVGLVLAASGGGLLVGSANPMPISDNSGSITVDNGGTFAVQAAQSGTWNVGTVTTVTTVSAVTSITNVVHVDDNSGSLTVDAPVGTPVFVRLSDGAAAITTLPVSLASVPSHAVTNAGTFATQDSQVLTDNGAFTDGTSKLWTAGYIYDEVAGTALTENDVAAGRINVNRAVVHTLEDGVTRGRYATVTASNALKVDASGVAVPITDNAGSLTVDNAGTFAVQAAQSGTWNVGTLTSITNVVHVDDNAGSLTVDNAGTFAVQAAQSGTWTVQPGNTANTTPWLANPVDPSATTSTLGTNDLASTSSSNALGQTVVTGTPTANSSVTCALSGHQTVALFLSGNINLTVALERSFDGGTTYTTFPMELTEAVGYVTAVAINENKSTFLRGNSTGATHVRVRCTAWTSGTATVRIQPSWQSSHQNISLNQVIGNTVATNTGTATTGTLRVVLATDQAQLTNALKVDGSAVTQPVSGTVSITANSSVNVNQLGGVAISSGNGVSGTGVLRVAQVSDGTGVLATVSTVTTVSTLTGSGVASGSADSGNPHKIGAVGKTANPTAVSDGQRVNLIADKLGKLVTVGAIRDLKGIQQTSISSSTSETTIVTAAGAGVFADIYSLIITNTSATVCKVTIKDSTAGTTRFVFEVPATETRGFTVPVDSAAVQATANNNWTATCGTSVATIEITALYVKNT